MVMRVEKELTQLISTLHSSPYHLRRLVAPRLLDTLSQRANTHPRFLACGPLATRAQSVFQPTRAR